MTQAQQTHPSTIRSVIPLAVASLLVSALVGVAVVLTQVAPLRIDTTAPSRSYAVNTAETWEAQRDAISVAAFPDTATAAERAWESIHAQISAATYDQAASSGPDVTRASSRTPVAR